MKLPTVILLSILACGSVRASNATAYVDGTLGADCTTGNYSTAARTCTGSAGNAYNTIQEAVTFVSGSGNTILVRAGAYGPGGCTVTSTIQSVVTALVFVPTGKNGTSGAYNVVKGYGDGAVTLDGSTCGEAFSVASNFWQVGGLGANEGFTFGDFRFRRQGDYSWEATVYTNSTGLRVYGNTFQGTTYTVAGSIDTDGEIRAFGDSHDIQNNNITMKGQGSAINLSTSFTLNGCNANGDSCAVNGSGCDCGGNHIIRGNTIQWDTTFSAQDRHVCLFANGMHDTLIEQNSCTIGSSAVHATASNFVGAWYDRYWLRATFQNNYTYVYGVAEYGFYHQDCCSNERSVYVNNTFAGSSSIGFFNPNCDGCEFRNNIVRGDVNSGSSGGGFDNCFQLAISGGAGGSGPVGYNNPTNCTNRYSNGSSAVVPSGHTNETANDIVTSPTFVGSGAKPVPFYRLNAGSPVIGVGNTASFARGAFSSVAKPTTDYDGDIRGGAIDIGADEQATATGDTVAPSSISNLVAAAPSKAPSLGVSLAWTAPSDSGTGSTGSAASYVLVGKGAATGAAAPTISTCADGALLTAVLDSTGAFVTTLPPPRTAGQSESWTVKGLRPNWQYAFAICSLDAAPNQSSISNVVNLTTAKYEGYGYQSTGAGFTGSTAPTVCRVTSLSDSGAGSLRGCLAGDTYIGFAVGGTINLLTLLNGRLSNYTVDGSTAPSPGITIQADASLPAGINDMIRLGGTSHVIWTYLRVMGKKTWPSGSASNTDLCFMVAAATAGTTLQHLVMDHLTIRNCGDSAWDMYDQVQDASLAKNLIVFNQHPQTTGRPGATNSTEMSWYRNLWSHNGERQPQLLLAHADMDLRNNVHHDWSYGNSAGAYAIRIRNSPAGSVSANIVNNFFAAGTNTGAIHYGTGLGCDAEEGTCAGCAPQSSNGTAGAVCSTTTMGQIWFSGNTFTAGVPTDTYSTVAAERSVPAAAAVTTVAASALCTAVLNDVGTHYQLSDETAAIGDAFTAMSCTGGATCGDALINGLEVCDGANLNSQTCVSQGFTGGTLSCSANCLSFNTALCTVSTFKSATVSGVSCSGCTVQ